MVGTFPDNEWKEIDEWLPDADLRAMPDDWGWVTIECGYGSCHDQCNTTPFKGMICDDCITAKSHLLETDEEENKKIWADRRNASREIARKFVLTGEEYSKMMEDLRKQATLEEWLEAQGVDLNEYYARAH